MELWGYRPAMMRTEVVTAYGRVAMGGTAHTDVRELTVDEQIQLLLDDRGTTAVLDAHYDEDLTRSRRIQPARRL